MGMLFTINRVEAEVRRVTHAGREYLIAPVVAIREGVLNGELATAEEIGRYVEAWNGIPVPLGHPNVRGVPVSANSPDIVARCPGRFYNAEMVGDRLRGEIWMDVALCEALGGESLAALQRLESGEPTEVSTAYFRDVEDAPGEWRGETYLNIQHNLRPDHLAILLHETGACSWEDGCGVPRVNSSQQDLSQQNTGIMVALYVPQDDAQALAVLAEQLPEGSEPLPVAEMHVTLAYIGDMGQMGSLDQSQMLEFVMNFAKYQPVLRAQVSGMGRFNSSHIEGMQALYASVEGEELHAMRDGLVRFMADALNLRASRFHGYVPHVTLAYVPSTAPMPNVLPAAREIVFDRIALAWGDQVTFFPLQGEVPGAVATNSANSPKGSWVQHALRSIVRVLGLETNEQESEEVPMAEIDERQVLVDKLAANGRCPVSQDGLGKLELADLQAMEKALASNCGGGGAGAQTPPEPSPELVELRTLTETIQGLGGLEAVKAAVETVRANATQEKTDLVQALAANQACAFEQAELEAMSVEQLRKLETSLRPADYSGRGGPRTNRETGEIVEAPMPTE